MPNIFTGTTPAFVTSRSRLSLYRVLRRLTGPALAWKLAFSWRVA